MPHFIGDHGEAPAHFACASGFNRCVQGQQVGLFGNAVNHTDDAVDLLTVLGQLLDHLGSGLHPAGQAGDGLLHAADHLLAAAGQVVCCL